MLKYVSSVLTTRTKGHSVFNSLRRTSIAIVLVAAAAAVLVYMTNQNNQPTHAPISPDTISIPADAGVAQVFIQSVAERACSQHAPIDPPTSIPDPLASQNREQLLAAGFSYSKSGASSAAVWERWERGCVHLLFTGTAPDQVRPTQIGVGPNTGNVRQPHGFWCDLAAIDTTIAGLTQVLSSALKAADEQGPDEVQPDPAHTQYTVKALLPDDTTPTVTCYEQV